MKDLLHTSQGIISLVIALSAFTFGVCTTIYFAATRSNGPRETTHINRCTVANALGLFSFVVGFWFSSLPWKFAVVITYTILLAFALHHCRRAQAAIRAAEKRLNES